MSFILLVEQAAPETPSANQVVFYAKSDGRMYSKDDAGTESNLQSIFAAGTRMLFQQTAAPTGWTKESSATYNDAALRFTTGTVGTGGADAFNTLFGTSKSTAGFTLTTAEIPSHTHIQQMANAAGGTNSSATVTMQRTSNVGAGASLYAHATGTDGLTMVTINTQSTGDGGSHSHTLSNMDLKFIDNIVAQKD